MSSVLASVNTRDPTGLGWSSVLLIKDDFSFVEANFTSEKNESV